MLWRFKHVPTGRLIAIETRAGLRHCVASRYWEELR